MKKTTKNQDQITKAKYFYNEAVLKMAEGKDMEAVGLYHKAAELGLMQAQYNLALIYTTGSHNIKPDLKKAAKLYELAAKQGCEEAAHNLSRLSLTGVGTKKNLRKAYDYAAKSTAPKDKELTKELKSQAIDYLTQGLSLWAAAKNVETHPENPEQLIGQQDELLKLFLAYRGLVETKSRTRTVKHLQNECQQAENELIEIVPKLIDLLKTFKSINIGASKMLYEMATQIATDIQKYDDSFYKTSKDELTELRKLTWKQLTPEERTDIKSKLDKQKQEKKYIETEPEALFKTYNI